MTNKTNEEETDGDIYRHRPSRKQRHERDVKAKRNTEQSEVPSP